MSKGPRLLLCFVLAACVSFLTFSAFHDSSSSPSPPSRGGLIAFDSQVSSRFGHGHHQKAAIERHQEKTLETRSRDQQSISSRSHDNPFDNISNLDSLSSRPFWSSFPPGFQPWFLRSNHRNHEKTIHPDSPVIKEIVRRFLSTKLAIWPDEDPSSDRIINQLMYIPEGYVPFKPGSGGKEKLEKPGNGTKRKNKKIFLFYGRGGWSPEELPMGQDRFLLDKCPVNTCELTMDPSDAESADAVFFKDRFQFPDHHRHPRQIWILYLLETPPHTQSFRNLHDVINWTATYRHDSDIVAPYEKYFTLYGDEGDLSNQDKRDSSQTATFTPKSNDEVIDHKVTNRPWEMSRGTLTGKDNKIAWFVSNCGARNLRLEYAHELSKYIKVDIFGACGSKRCPRRKMKDCFLLLNSTYKYYLAFENSNCRDYITEKFYVNGLGNNVVPIVMGGHPDDYERLSPPKSYIHVDDFASPKELAEFLHAIHEDESKYMEYLRWKKLTGSRSGHFVNTYFWCRVCALLHSPRAERESYAYPNLQSWWNPPGMCNVEGWRVKKNYAILP